MLKLPVRTWILNAAAVFSGRHGAVSRQAEQSGCSRQTVYQHARKLEQRLGDEPAPQPPADEQPRPAAVDTPKPATGPHVPDPAAVAREPAAVDTPKPATGPHVLLDKDKLKELTTTAFAMGVSLRQVEGLLGVLLPADEVPDHSTLGRWVQDQGQRAAAVLAALDPACADRVSTLALDEIFFGGDRPWLGSSRQA